TYTDEVTRPVLPPTHPDCRDCAYDIPLPDSASVCQGESLQLDATINPVPYNGPSFFQAHPLQSIDNEQFPANRPFQSSIAVNSLRRPILADARSRILSVCIDLEHSAAANLEFVLQSPSGQLMPLSTGRGGNGGGMENICFTSTAGQSILTATAPLSGDYRPEGNWSALNNSDLNGDWTLLVADNGNQVGSGFLRSWSIGFVNENEVTYSWSGGADLSCTDCPDPTVQPSAPTTYSLLINDDYNCQSNASIVVDWAGKLLPPVIDCGLSAPDAITFSWQPIAGASGYEVSLDGGNTWIPANGPLSHTVDGLTSITQVDIQVRGLTVGNLCEAEIGRSSCLFEGCQFTIDTFSTTHPSCHNTQDGSALLFNANANGDVRYFLNGNGPFSNSLVENIPAGQHLITAFDEIGCPASISFELIAPDPIQIILVADSVKCANESSGQIEAVVSGGTGAYQYSWSQIGAADNALLTSIPAGRYSLTVTDERACTAEATVDVGAPAPLRAFATATAARCT
ncbi:MAG: proprotein convertase P-domain-containing protein, partial [Bacteroidota bacterium]